ncbi:MAG: CPBP family intramembrane metalloprotease [Bacteroidales bacterium]|nr:CPBP family intramembrane metalloprotease [Bacteroidales bacterium]
MKVLNFSRFHPFVQLFILLALAIAGFCVFSFLMMVFGFVFLGGDGLGAISSLSNDSPESGRLFLKWMQGFVQIGVMLVPALIFACFYDNRPFKMLKINRVKYSWRYLIAIALPFAVLPLAGLLNEWNNAVKFPEFLASLEQYLRNMEENAARMTEIFLYAETGWGLLLNIIIIAVIPAISEEFLFRGVLQNIFKRWFGNVHWAVIVTALIFSAIHGQFFGFLPRFVLGLMLGYLFVTMKSIWAPVIAHFVNNGTATVVAFLASKGIMETSAEEFGVMSNAELWGLISAAAMVGIFYLLWRKNERTINAFGDKLINE